MRLARRSHPDLKALFCTGYADVSDFETDDDMLLKKPFGPDALIEAVQQALQRDPTRERENVVLLRRGEQSRSR